MIFLTPQSLFFLETILFATVIFMHIAKKNFTVVFLYMVQSLIIVITLLQSSIKESSLLLIFVTLVTFFVKVIIIPYFFLGLIKKHKLQFSVSTNLNLPMTLMILALLTTLSFSNFLKPLSILAIHDEKVLFLSLGMMFISIFLIINRKGVLSQMTGILSLENAIVSFAFITGLEASAGPQIGILFNILVWVIIATTFASKIYQHFGSWNTLVMKKLKEE